MNRRAAKAPQRLNSRPGRAALPALIKAYFTFSIGSEHGFLVSFRRITSLRSGRWPLRRSPPLLERLAAPAPAGTARRMNQAPDL